MLRPILITTVITIISLTTLAQKIKKTDKAVITQLQAHVAYLADDKLEGRRAGTEGEQLASTYISRQFAAIGVQPKGDNNTYLQAFEINDGKEISKSSFLIINGEEIKAGDYFPFMGSTAAGIEAMPSVALHEQGMPWLINLKEPLEENKTNPHFDVKTFVIEKINEAAKKGATAVVVFNTGTIADGLKFDGKEKAMPFTIPAAYVNNKVAAKYFADESATPEIKMKLVLSDKKRTGNNVVGYINNDAATTVIIGAHYDHLGYGEDGNSMIRTGPMQIHNGADDNASGTAALIELARLLKAGKAKANNYLVIAFSGEELGLYGSKHFAEHATIDLAKANYMINMDMVGRLNDSTKVLTVGGYGTSPYWGQNISTINSNSFVLKYDSSGTGPSDHTSFYRKDIPVLFFFTGLHTDYHKPTDDFYKINYTGQYRIVKLIYKIIEATNNKGKLVFTKTRETQTTTSARFSVSMGIMPDYTFAETGVRVDGVSEGRPAQKAGIKAGDIITQLGDYPVVSVEAYMQALGKFKKGDKAKVQYKRGKETLTADIQF
ncbi:MAG: hypothetical protein RLZZ316_3090 [Bacteroidota bacterium]